jgi:hypothetical protein
MSTQPPQSEKAKEHAQRVKLNLKKETYKKKKKKFMILETATPRIFIYLVLQRKALRNNE